MTDGYEFEYMVKIKFSTAKTRLRAKEDFTTWITNKRDMRPFDIIEFVPIKKVINPAKQIGRAGVGQLRIIGERPYEP